MLRPLRLRGHPGDCRSKAPKRCRDQAARSNRLVICRMRLRSCGARSRRRPPGSARACAPWPGRDRGSSCPSIASSSSSPLAMPLIAVSSMVSRDFTMLLRSCSAAVRPDLLRHLVEFVAGLIQRPEQLLPLLLVEQPFRVLGRHALGRQRALWKRSMLRLTWAKA